MTHETPERTTGNEERLALLEAVNALEDHDGQSPEALRRLAGSVRLPRADDEDGQAPGDAENDPRPDRIIDRG